MNQMNELLNKSTGITLSLAMKIAGAVVAFVLFYGAISARLTILELNQKQRIDANTIGSIEILKAKDIYNDARLSKIEVETEDYAQNKIIFKQMAEDLKEIKDYLMK